MAVASSLKPTSHIISNMHLAEDAGGVDFKVFGDTTGNYVMWDASLNRWLTSGTGSTFYIGAHGSTAAGSGVALAEAGPSAAMRVYADDGGVAIGTAAGSVPDVRNALFRTLITIDNAAFDMRLFSVQGHIKSVNGEWGDEQVAAVHGYLELVRTTGTVTLQSYGVTAGVMATVETSGTFGVAATHNLAGLAAVSKLGYSGTFTDNTNTSGVYVGIYNSTYWSDSPSCDKWNHGLYVAANSADKGIQIGELSSTTQLGLTLVTASGFEGVSVYTDDGNVALTGGTPFAGIHTRTMFFQDQAGGTTVIGGWGHLKYYSGVDIGPARVSALEGYNELLTTNLVKSGGYLVGVTARMEATAGTFTVNSGGICAGFHAQLTGAATVVQDSGGILAGLKVDTAASTGDWGYGIYVASGDKQYYGINTVTGSTATNSFEIVVTDEQTNASGYTRALAVSLTSTGDKTSTGECNAVSIDLAPTGDAYIATPVAIYTADCGDGVISNLWGIYMYMDDIGGSATVTTKYGMSIGIDNGDNATTCGYFRLYNHGGASTTMDYVFDFPNAGHGVATYFFHAGATGGLIEIGDITNGKSCTHGLRVLLASTPLVIPLYED